MCPASLRIRSQSTYRPKRTVSLRVFFRRCKLVKMVAVGNPCGAEAIASLRVITAEIALGSHHGGGLYHTIQRRQAA
jgi:hypothetical protein